MSQEKVYARIHGTTAKDDFTPASGIFHIGGPTFPCFVGGTDGAGINVMQYDESTFGWLYVNDLTTLHARLAAVNLGTMQKKIVNITKAFTSDPNPANFAGEYGVMLSSGSQYAEGTILYSTGSSIDVVKTYNDDAVLCSHITTSESLNFSTQPNLDANSLYAWENGQWIKKGSASTTSGLKVIKIPFSSPGGTFTSSTTIAIGDLITKIDVYLTASDSNNRLLRVLANTEELMNSQNGDIHSSFVGHYQRQDTIVCGANHAGPINVVAQSGWTGAGMVYVYTVTPVS